MANKRTNFGKILAKFRKTAGLSQNELAQAIEMSPSHLSKIEQGNRNPFRKKNLVRIIKVLGLNGEEQKNLLSAAGYSSKLHEPLVLYSPSSSGRLEMEPPERKDIVGLKNPAVKIVAEILSDPELPIESRKEIEKNIISFAEWSRDKKKEEIYKK